MNNVSLIGRLTANPDYRSGKEADVVNITLAVDRYGKATDFIPVKAFNQTADFIDDYCVKGQRIGVVGRIQVQNYEDKEGNERTYTCVIASSVFFADANAKTRQEEEEPDDMEEPEEEEKPSRRKSNSRSGNKRESGSKSNRSSRGTRGKKE